MKDELGIQPQTECLFLLDGVSLKPRDGFALTQYQKERNLLEEYAFRESVAVTLTAYLEQMPEEDDDKRKMLMSTVEQLYTKPVIANKEYDLIKFDTKDLSELTKTLRDAIDSITGKK